MSLEHLYLGQGGAITVDLWNQLVAQVGASRISSVLGGQVSSGPGTGTSLVFGGRSGRARRTMLLYQASATEIGVSYGEINNVTPTIGGSPLGDSPQPKLTITGSGKVYLHVKVTADGVIDEADADCLTVESAASIPTPTATEGYLSLGEVDFADEKITAVRPANWNVFQMGKCGKLVYQWGGFGA